MEDVEKKLAEMRFAEPPKWLKARVAVAAQDAAARQARSRKIKTTIWAAVAAGVLLAILINYIAQSLSAVGGRPSPVRASPVVPLPGLPDLLGD